MAKLTVTRPRQYVDMLRAYQIDVDGMHQATIRYGQTVEIDVSPGRHEITARIDWCRSNSVEVEVEAGGERPIEVGSNVAGSRLLLGLAYSTVWRDRYLYLS